MKLMLSLLIFSCLGSSISGWSVDFQHKKNADGHHTSRFQDSSRALIVRRVQDIQFIVTAEANQTIKVSLRKVTYPRNNEHREVLSDEEVKKVVRVEITPLANIVTLKFTPAAEVGKYELEMDIYNGTTKVGGKSTILYLLFNPWVWSEPVYLANTTEVNEYVQSDSANYWDYGQYEKGILDIVCKVLSLAMTDRKNDAVKIVRAITAIANNHTEGGIIEGRWRTSDFENGTNPAFWASSVQILKEYNQTNRPVKYGQCWVFSAVITTILRSIGIPTREVTTVASAADKTRDILVNKCLTEDGSSFSDGNSADPISSGTTTFGMKFGWVEMTSKTVHLTTHITDGTRSIVLLRL